jgi:dihydrofolate synthase/folylpolyglutamate synthase
VEAAVLEVGLGGRLDATNAVDADLAVIVSIDLDHVQTLGPTIERIAEEKAGIVKAGRPLVSGVVQQAAVNVLREVCRPRGAALIDARLAVRLADERGDAFTLETERGRYADLRLALPGRHQIDNARVALAAFEVFAARCGLEPDPAAVRTALARVHWPGRLQWIPANGARPRLLLDGAHNPAGARTLAGYLRGLGGPRPVAVTGAMHGKLLAPMFEALGPHLHAAVVTRPAVERAEDPRVVAAEAARHVSQVEVVEDPARALERAAAVAEGDRFVVVTGSLYLVGEILALLGDPGSPGPVAM